VISDLAVHDFSILDYLLREQPGGGPLQAVPIIFPGTPENLAYITLFYDSGTIAHAKRELARPGQGGARSSSAAARR